MLICLQYVTEEERRIGVKDRYLLKAKRIDNGEWVEGLLTIMWGQYHIINPNDENTAYPIDTDTICQYTGLTDKNGNKIWENDFVKTEKGLIYKIFWHKSFFRLSGSLQDENNHLGSRFWLNLWEINNIRCKEVIGNCFDNPELIGE